MNNIIAIDVETANPDMSSICQVGIVEFSDGNILERFNSLVNPEAEFNPWNEMIHGISEDDVRHSIKMPKLFNEIRPILENKIIAHYTSFDKNAFMRAAERFNLEPINCFWLNVHRVVHRTWKDTLNHSSLEKMCERFGVPLIHHYSISDATAAGLILMKAIEDSGISLEDWLKNSMIPLHTAQSMTHEGNPNGDLYGEVAVFTGALSIPRHEAAQLAANAGCKVENAVKLNTTLLVVGDQDVRKLAGYEKSIKQRRAEELISNGQKIKIVYEEDFFKMVS